MPHRSHARPARPRIAFVSAHFKAHTIGRLNAPLLERLPRDGYELATLAIGQHDDEIARRIARAADVACAVPETLAAAREALAVLAADVIVYCDLGMDPWTTYLAAERFAPVQCVMWGHPVTSGLPTADYFLSSRLIEPPDGAEHYRETLVALPCWPVLYDDPGQIAPAARAAFGVAAGRALYFCPQSLFKLHPDFDHYLAAILRRDASAEIVLIAGRAAWQARLEARFARVMPDVAGRIRFLPPQDGATFKSLLAAADIVLDTLHFSGGYTSFETVWAETPFVTERGRFMRGRVTAGLCDLLELAAPLAAGADDYAARAVALVHDHSARDAMRTALAERKQRLLALDDEVLPAYRAFFHHALARAAEPAHQEPIA